MNFTFFKKVTINFLLFFNFHLKKIKVQFCIKTVKTFYVFLLQAKI